MAIIRGFRPADLDGVYRVALLTGASGRDASALYRDPKLVGHVYAAPYALLRPESALIVEHDDEVAGYIVGAPDTRTFEAALERDWWPALRAQYPNPADIPRAEWDADILLSNAIHRPWPTPGVIVDEYPSHLHINLLPPLQGQGLGRTLIDQWLELMRAQGSRGAHLGVGRANERAVRFYRAYGLREIELAEPAPRGSLWFATSLTEASRG
jgi:ribosomal protein S18 acetylase RimI-like enzyme